MAGEKDIEVNTKTKEGVKGFLKSQRGQKMRINLVVINMNSHQQVTSSCTETTDVTLDQVSAPVGERLGIKLPTEGFFQLAITHVVTPMLKMKKV